MKKRSDEERFGAVLSFRVPQQAKATLVKEAASENRRLSDYLLDLLVLGRETMQIRAKTAKAEAETAAKAKVVEQETPAREEPKEEPKGSKSSWSNEAGPVDEVYLTDVKSRYPGLNHGRLLERLDNVLRESGKSKTRGTIEKLFQIASEKAGKAGKR